VLPNSQDAETHSSETLRIAEVASSISVDLLPPPIAVVLRTPKVSTAAVPEASMNENGDSMMLEDNVRTSRQV